MVGRTRELGQLLEVAQNPPALIVVEGEPGVGKTRLVEEFLGARELAACQRLLGRCSQLGEPFPLGPLVEALRQARFGAAKLSPVVGVLRPLLPELERWLPESLDALGDLRAERHRLFRALREVLSSLGSVTVVLEDLHWADRATVEFLSFLLPQPPPELVIVGTYRREDLPAGSGLLGLPSRLRSDVSLARVPLSPLDPGQVRDLISAILQTDAVSHEFANLLHERTAGLPYAVEEVLLLLRERDDLVRRPGGWVRHEVEQIGVPNGLRDSILQRLGGLPDPARRVLQAAAIVAVPVTERTLLDVAGILDEQGDAALADALAARLLTESKDGSFQLRHALAGQALADSLSAPVRRRMHLRAAHALEAADPTPYAQLAHHYRAAGDSSRWIEYAEAAADRALSLQDTAAAYELLKTAVSAADVDPTARGRLAIKFATLAYPCQEADEAVAVVRDVLEQTTLAPVVRGELRLLLARLLSQTGQRIYDEVVLALAELDDNSALAAEAMAVLSEPWVAPGGLADSLYWLDRAIDLVDGASDPLPRRIVAVQQAINLLAFGDTGWQRAVDSIPPAGTTAGETRRAVATEINLAAAALKVGHYQSAAEFIQTGSRAAEEAGFQFGVAALMNNQLLLDWATGNWSGLEVRAQQQSDVLQDWSQARAEAHGIIGLILLARGQVLPALELLSQLGEPHTLRLDLIPVVAWTSEAMARVRLAEGDAGAAIRVASWALGPIQDGGAWVWGGDVVSALVESLLAVGRHAEAGDLLNRFEDGIGGRDAPAAAAGLMVCRGLTAESLGENADAADAYLAAERLWRSLPQPYQAGRARERAGGCLVGVDRERGCQLLIEARDAFTALGATWDEARASSTLRTLGALPPHRRGRRGYGNDLSPRERQVTQLAAEGLTNNEIALTLFVSAKTVEKHLSSALHKLGLASRNELASQPASDDPSAKPGGTK